MANARLLIVDDEDLLRSSIAKRMVREGFEVVECSTSREARERPEEFQVALVDIRLPDGSGMDVARSILDRAPDCMVILLTAYSSIDGAVEAIKFGAYDYLTKPVPMERLVLTVRRAIETAGLRSELSDVRRDRKEKYGLSTIVASDPSMKKVVALVGEVARSDARILVIRGESGSGKSLLARAIHYESPRQEKPFVHITCTTLQDALLESELFGHERGAFTDAKERKRGLFEAGDGGTVFLDEISEMSERLQSKLLQFLDDQTFRRIGGLEDHSVNVRLIAASNRDLEELVRARRFREDLYYRINVIPIHLPPLRERKGDVPELARRFIAQYNREFRKGVVGLTDEGMDLLLAHSWPGNVRELKNVIERAVLLAAGPRLQPRDLVIGTAQPLEAGGKFRLPTGGLVLEDVEKDLLTQALQASSGNLVKAAKLLGISKDTLRYRLKKFGLRGEGISPSPR